MTLATGLLVRLPNYVGDAVCALPALQALATRGALLALGPSWAVPLLAAAGLAARPYPRGLRARVGVLRATAQDAGTRRILLLTHSFSSALEARLAGLAPIGFAKDGRRLLLARSAGRLPGRHLVEDYAHLARVADAPVDVSMAAWTPTWPGPRADNVRIDAAHARAQAALGDARPYALLVPRAGGGHGGATKDWPSMARLMPVLRAAGLRVVMAPGPGEAAAFAAAAPGAETLGGLDLVALGVLAAKARVVIAPDCGPGHLAAAAGARGVAIFGPTDPARSRPWSPRVEVLGGGGAWPTESDVHAAIARLLASP